ncbi:MAG: hypothetical protein V4760_01960 [Bdellovibrionota bacterium]
MKSVKRSNILKSEEGIISLDFIFALTMAFGFAAIFFVMALTLATVEAGQYITFATARTFHGAHENQNMQRDLALEKFEQLTGSGIFSRIFNQSWFTLKNPQVGDFNGQYPESDPDNAIFVGAQVEYRAKVLNMRLPVVGNTTEDDNSPVGSAILNAYLMREVTSAECRDFNSQRYEKIRKLDSKYDELPTASATLVTDNGC